MAVKFGNSIDLDDFQLLNFVVHNAAVAPASVNGGAMFWDTANEELKVFDTDGLNWFKLVEGSATSTDEGIVLWDGSTGKRLADSGITINSTGSLLDSATSIPVSSIIKNYIDNAVTAFVSKLSARCATTAALTAVASRTSTTITFTSGLGPLTIDDVTLSNGNIILVKDETTYGFSNGIYERTSQDVWNRITEADTWDKLISANCWVEEGTENLNSGWLCTINQGGTLGTTAVTFALSSVSSQLVAGRGLLKSGDQLIVDIDGLAAETTLASADKLIFSKDTDGLVYSIALSDFITAIGGGTGSGESFKTWVLTADSGYTWGTSNLVAAVADTLDLVAGTGIEFRTDPILKALRITATVTGGIADPGISVDREILTWNGTTGDAVRVNTGAVITDLGNLTVAADVIAFASGSPNPSFWDSMPAATTTTMGGFMVYDTQFEMVAGYLQIKDGVLAPAVHDIIGSTHTSTGSEGQFLRTGALGVMYWDSVTPADIGAEPADADIQTHINITDGNPHGTDYSDVGAIADPGVSVDREILTWNGITGNAIRISTGAVITDLGNLTVGADVIAFASGSPNPSFWDSMPKATETTMGGFKFYSTQFEWTGTGNDQLKIKDSILVPAEHEHDWTDITSGIPANLTSLIALTYVSTAFVKMTGANTFSLDTNTYSLSSHDHSGTYQPLNTNLTSLAGLTYVSTSFVKMTGTNTFTLDTNTYSLSSHTHTNMVDYSGTPVDNQIAIFADVNTIEGTANLTFNGTTFYLGLGHITSGVADGAAAVGFSLVTPAYTTTGAKLLSILNNTTEMLSLDKDGTLAADGDVIAYASGTPSSFDIDSFKTWTIQTDSGYTWGSSNVVAAGMDTIDIVAGAGISVHSDSTLKAIRISVTSGGGMVYPSGSGIPTVVSGTSWGTTISPSTGYLTYTGSAYAWVNETYSLSTHIHTGVYQPLATNLTSLAGLTYVSLSFIKMSAAGTFSLDTNTYSLTSHDHSGVYQPLDTGLTSLAGLTYVSASFVKMTGADTFTLDTNTYSLSSHNHDTEYISIVTTPTAGNFPILTSGGELSNSTYSPSSFSLSSHDHSGTYQPLNSNLTSLAGLSYVSASFVKMTGTNTFTLDTNTYSLSSHTHGNISNTGYLGSTASIPLITGTAGIIQAGSFGTTIGTFCQGNDSRLSDARTPTAHQLDSITYHTVSGLTTGHFLKATSSTTFAFGAHGLTYSDVGAIADPGTSVDYELLVWNGTGGNSVRVSVGVRTDANESLLADGDIIAYASGTPSSFTPDTFKTWHLASDSGYTWGTTDIVASGSDTMDFVAGTGITLSTDATLKAIRITASGGSMVYPGAGIAISTGSAWATSITPSTGYLRYTGSVYEWKNETYSLSTHVHGNITNAGAIGTTSGLPVVTTTSGVLTTGTYSLTFIGNGSAQYQIPVTGSTPFTPTWILGTNLVGANGLNSLSYVSTSFVKMTAAGTFSLDTNTYSLSTHVHGDISNTGTITSTAVTATNTDYLLISDTSASGLVQRAILIGSSTTTYLRNDGTWSTPAGTYVLPLAASGTRGGIQIGYTATGANIPLALSSEMGYVALTKTAIETVFTGAITTHTHAYAATIHNLIDTTNHPVTGLTTGHFLKATGTTTYAFAAHGLTYTDVGAAATSHSHGSILTGGTITATAVTPADTDYIVITDTSASGLVSRGILIGTGTTTFLRNDGTWATPTGGGVTLTGSTNDTICTVTGANAIQGEANLTFDGGTLTANSTVKALSSVNARGTTATNGYVAMAVGDATYTGYAEWYKPGTPTRTAYMGYDTDGLAIHMTSGDFRVYATGTELGFYVTANGAVELYYDGSIKLQTSSIGLSITGSITPSLGMFVPESPASDHTAGGVKVNMTAGETLVVGDVLYFKSDGKVWKADANATSAYPAMGLAMTAVSANATVEVLLYGIARDDTWAWTVGGVLYLSATVGTMTQTAPTGSGTRVQVIGVATHADRIFFNPSNDLITLSA